MSILLKIKSNSIYTSSLVYIEFIGQKDFSIGLKLEVIEILKGQILSSDFYKSVFNERNNCFSLKFLVANFYNEHGIYDEKTKVSGRRYGMRFYPFVSSKIKHRITAQNGEIDKVLFEIPDAYKFIFDGSKILKYSNDSTLKVSSVMRHSQELDKSIYYFTWPKVSPQNASIEINIPVRLGSKALLKLITFPMVYWILSLIAIAFASQAGNLLVVIGAIVALWLFMIRQLVNANLPQQNTILTRIYIIGGILALVWGIGWEIINEWILIILPFILFYTYVTFASLRSYIFKGTILKFIAKYLSDLIVEQDNKRIESWDSGIK